MHDTYLFDVDGTLVTMELNFTQIKSEIRGILGNHGVPSHILDESTSVLESIKMGVEYLRDHALDWEGLKEEAETHLETRELQAASRAVPIDGAQEILGLLQEKGVKIGVITRNNRKVVMQVLKKSGLDTYVDIILARDDVEKVKPHPNHILSAIERLHSSPERTVVVGDHHYEIWAGNRAGCYTIGVLTGSGTRDTLRDAHLIIHSVRELKDFILQEQ
ncbi:MAG: HAD family hydrolase [Theionarchaea archaeon]|nr:HAD family hydrolase [Theionarchaea archaeon]